MAISKEDNDLITCVDNDAPLGRMLLQHYWIPVVPSAALEAGGNVIPTKLCGKDFVAYRNGNGKVGVMDELCPHRQASMILANNEQTGLRCIFHGWKFNTEGDLTEAPNHNGDEAKFCKSIKTSKYQVRDVGGIVWAWFGKGEAPVFPEFPYTSLPEEHYAVTSQEVACNYLQGIEATMDTTHAGSLHQSSVAMISNNNDRANLAKSAKPKFHFDDRPYGFRYAAVRALPDGKQYARVNNFIMPWFGMITAPEKQGPSTIFFSVPIDDNTHRAWFVHFNLFRPLGLTNLSVTSEPLNFPPLPIGDKSNAWGQDRKLMQKGYFSGFPQHFATEDFAIFLSQGPRLDRSNEQLCTSDMALVKVRNNILNSVREYMDGKDPKLARNQELDYRKIVSFGGVFPEDKTWEYLLEDKELLGKYAS